MSEVRLIDVDNVIINFGFEWDDICPTRDEVVAFLRKQKTIAPDEEIAHLRAELARVERERDAAVADMKSIIRKSPPHTDPGDVCTHPCGKIEIRVNWCDKFEWRGTEETR